jgi:hypothetical protein
MERCGRGVEKLQRPAIGKERVDKREETENGERC